MTGVIGALVEAWDELRIHRLRVLLALIGVAVAVTAITGIAAAVNMLNQAITEQTERWNGRQVTLQVGAWDPSGQNTGSIAALEEAFTVVPERYGVSHTTRDRWSQTSARFPGGAGGLELRGVDVDLGVMNRVALLEGRWFTDRDAEAFAPSLVVNEAFLASLGVPDLSSRPTVLVGGHEPVRSSVIGVVPNEWDGAQPFAFVLYDQAQRWGLFADEGGPVPPSLSLWVPDEIAGELNTRLANELAAAAPGWRVDVYDNRGWSDGFDDATRWVGLGIGAFALLLGGLGLVNIALVTVRYRIREIGIRRSFGATSARVFFGVMLESVVATAVAGVIGVVLAVAIIKNIPVETLVGGGIQDMPPFPLSAAVLGMAAATGIGALAGLIPATVAVRVKVIDAIRYV